MTDLRTRIITALLSEDDVALMADAVIRELKMVRRSSFISEDGSQISVSEWERCRMKTPANGWQSQYVTEWTADE